MFGHLKRCTNSLNQISITSKKLHELYIRRSKLVSNFIPCRHVSSAGELTDTSSSSYPDEDEETNPFMLREIKKYNVGKRWLARMMGADIETFTQRDIDEALQYLLPSHLWAKDARPSMKHPYESFPKSEKSKFDTHGRPNESAFYMGKPRFHNLVFEIWTHMERLNNPVYESEAPLTLQETGTSVENDQDDIAAEPKIMQWVKKMQIEEILNETVTDKNYDVIIFRLKKLAKHERAKEIQGFLQQFQVAIHTSGEELKDVDIYENSVRAMGYRRTSIAEVVLREGTGVITVNNKPLLEYFFLLNDREQIMVPLLVINELNKFDIEAHVIGGGPRGQSGAIRLGISRAIAALYPQHFNALNDACLLIRDYRKKERKKPGRKKARRAFQWVKR